MPGIYCFDVPSTCESSFLISEIDLGSRSVRATGVINPQHSLKKKTLAK
jgi:hypothetical protein